MLFKLIQSRNSAFLIRPQSWQPIPSRENASLLFIIFKLVPIFQFKVQWYSYSLTVLDAAKPAPWHLALKATKIWFVSSNLVFWLIHWQSFKVVMYQLHDSRCDPPPKFLLFSPLLSIYYHFLEMQDRKAADRLYIQQILTLDIQAKYKVKWSVSLSEPILKTEKVLIH